MTFSSQLPGADLVTAGLRDLNNGDVTVEALLVLIATPRLTAAGIKVPRCPIIPETAELGLYRRVAAEYRKRRTPGTTAFSSC